MSGSRAATAKAKERRRNVARPRATCVFCRQAIKMFHARTPVRRGKNVIGWAHPGCGLRGTKNDDGAKRRRQFAIGARTSS